MLYKKLGTEAIEMNWEHDSVINYFKIPSTLIIPKSVWKIGKRAFDSCEKLREVIIPKSVDVIGYRAFQWCVNLKKVEIPNSIWKIEACAFWGCEDAEVILEKPEWEFKRIGDYAFYNCKSVEYVEEETRT